jgi:hypothetical protein
VHYQKIRESLLITGNILKESDITAGEYLSVSQDGDIYVCHQGNVNVSTDDGMTWSIKFSALDNNSYVQQAIKVSSDQYTDIFWTVEFTPFDVNGNTQLYIYTLHMTADTNVIKCNSE